MLDCLTTEDRERTVDQSTTLFLLRRSNSNSTASLQVDFTPLSHKEQCMDSPTKKLPIFNQDCKYFTPAFIVAIDEAVYMQNQQSLLNLYMQKAAYIAEQKRELLIPKPSKNNSYCCVCKMPFDDYLLHIKSVKHQRLIRQSDYCQKINSLCQSFRKAAQGKKMSYKRQARPAKINKVKPIGKSCFPQKIERKDTCIQESCNVDEVQMQMI